MAIRIDRVDAGSEAEALGLAGGDELLSVDGNELNDTLDYDFYTDSKSFHLKARVADGIREWDVRREERGPFGCDFSTYLGDQKHSCSNHCMFCFIDQLPPGMRESLYFKDDDERLSFLFGNYITMTNMQDHEIDRIIKMHISPINISVHTTNPQLRVRMLANKRGGEVLKYLPRLVEGGIAVNCQLYADSVLGQDFMGSAPTDDENGRLSRLELANGGTLFLEKIEYLAPELQSALLQVIKQGVLTRLDARRLIPVDVKVIATTTVDLANLVEQNRFSRQLYYALHSFEIVIPPLRARRNSIPSLVHNRLKSLEKRFSSRLKVDDDALAQLVAYSWPGNDFELNSVIENIAISSDNGHIRLSNLPEYLFSERPGGDSASSLLPASLTFSAIEKEAIIHAARVTSGRVQEMSQLLNIGRTTLWRKMKQYDIDASQFKRKHQA